MIRTLVFCALGLLVGSFVFIWLVGRIRYRIGSKQLKVVLFGLPLRRVSLLAIESIAKRPAGGLSEHWWSTFRPKHRMLVVRRKRGLFKNFVITPKNRYVFKTDLEKAMERARRHAGVQSVDAPEPQEFEEMAEVKPLASDAAEDLAE
jgi:hypothetical protein